ncbi:MAG: hypothetical protein Q8P13_02490 [bacterium]|nr:hypothetical protein [bacterium]
MAKADINPWHEELGIPLFKSDPADSSSLSNREAAAGADLIWIFVMPMAETWHIIADILPVVRAGTVIVIGSTVPVPNSVMALADEQIDLASELGVGLAFCHLIKGSGAKPRGRPGLLGYLVEPKVQKGGPTPEEVIHFILYLQARKVMTVFDVDLEIHNVLTGASQNSKWLGALESAEVQKHAGFPFHQAIEVAGGPAALVFLGEYAMSGYFDPHQLDVNLEGLYEGPETIKIIDQRIGALLGIRNDLVESVGLEEFKRRIKKRLPKMPRGPRRSLRRRFRMLAQADGDITGGGLRYEFLKTQDRKGLLVDALRTFREMHFESTLAQLIPENGHPVFYFVVTGQDSPEARRNDKRLREMLNPLPEPGPRRRIGRPEDVFMRQFRRRNNN